MNAVEVQAATMAERRKHLAACWGCGANLKREPVEHRPDCTVHPSPLLCAGVTDGEECDAIRLPSEKRPVWFYDVNSREYFCPEHYPTHKKGTTR